MATPNNTFNALSDALNLRDIIGGCIRRWYWFLLCALIAVGIAQYDTMRKIPVYSRYASILIKDPNTRRTSSSELEQMFSTGTAPVMRKLINEKLTFESPALMDEVVRRLGLQMDYWMDGRFHRLPLYGYSLPIDVKMLDINPNAGIRMQVNLRRDSSYVLSNLRQADVEYAYEAQAHPGDTLSTPLGRIVLTLTDNLNPSHYDKNIYVNHRGQTATVSSFGARLSVVEAAEKGDVLDISITDNSPQRAEDVLSTLITVYSEKWVEDRNKMVISTSHFIKERLADIERDLGEVDESIASFKSNNLIVDSKNASSTILEIGNSTQQGLQEVDNQEFMCRYVRNYILENTSIDELIPLPGSIVGEVGSYVSEYNNTVLNRNYLIKNSSVNNPLVMELTETLNTYRQNILSAVDAQLDVLNAQRANLQQKEKQINKKIADSPNQTKQLLSIERQQKVKESLYLYLLQKREENELSQTFTAYNTRVLTPPTGSMNPVYPQGRRNLMVALVIGLLIPLVVVYIMEVSNSTVRGKKDLENLSLPFVGEIPQFHKRGMRRSRILRLFKSKKQKKAEKLGVKDTVVKEGKRDVINEAFRVLRTNLEFMMRDDKGNVLILTSFNPGSGKTFLTINVAITLAIKGKRVLVVDGDLRHGSLSGYVDRPKEGLSNYLAGQIDDVNQVIIADELRPSLHILPTGTIPPNPSELIGSERFEDLITTMRSRYDYIIIDCPPVDIVADTQIIEKVTDRTIFVVRAGLLERSMLPELEKLYEEGKYKNMSLLLNGTLSEHNYGYRYGNRYGYKYGYKYGYYGYGGHKYYANDGE